MTILTIPQIDDATRYLAVSDDDASNIGRNPAMIECVTVLGSLDVASDGSRSCWVGPVWADVPEPVRAALREAAE